MTGLVTQYLAVKPLVQVPSLFKREKKRDNLPKLLHVSYNKGIIRFQSQ
jgi:hypothetical protein